MATKITELTANTLLASGDLVPVVDDPGGTPLTQKITFSNFIASIVALLTGAHVSTVADVNVIGGIPVLHRVLASALTGDVDVTLTHKTRVIEVWAIQKGGAGGAGDTITVKNGASAITNALDLNVADNIIVRAGTIDDATNEVAAAGTLRVTGASGVTAEVYILGIRVA